MNTSLQNLQQNPYAFLEEKQPAPAEAQKEIQAPAVHLAETILQQAFTLGASDIHLEPEKEYLVVRCRIDGVLQHLLTVPKNLQEPLLSRFKIASGMDIGEKRLPQDGRLQRAWQQKTVDIRVSSLPTIHGETLVLRLLNRDMARTDLAGLGFSPVNLQKLQQIIRQPHGLFLVTGPTGSGKSTTLYAALMSLDRKTRNIITVEDPVEYQIPGIRQVAVQPKIGLTFASCLRTILRQDPDMLMIGEIRDRETAAMSIHAALTGHLVFSTLHTNTAAGAVTRLLDMGIEPYLAASALKGVAAQQLVRRLCPYCRRAYTCRPDHWAYTYFQLTEQTVLYEARGCSHCRHTGYVGRMSLQEVLVPGENLRQKILQGTSELELEKMAFSEGMISLWQDGRQKVLAGETTPEEILRVLGPGRGL